jgi:hypothetical protein
MQRVLLITAIVLLGLSRAYATRYDGMLVRSSDSRPIVGATVVAWARQPWYSQLVGPMADQRLGECVTDGHGLFHFDLPYSSSRLLFVASSGTITRRRVDASTTVIFGGGTSLEHPKPRRLNVLKMPDGDVPATAHVAR